MDAGNRDPNEQQPPGAQAGSGQDAEAGSGQDAEAGSGQDAAPARAARRLTRSSGDSVMGGVCGGIARYLGIDSTVVRIVTVGLTLVGGAGALLYLAGLVLMPRDSAPPATAGAGRDNRTLTIVGVGCCCCWAGRSCSGAAS